MRGAHLPGAVRHGEARSGGGVAEVLGQGAGEVGGEEAGVDGAGDGVGDPDPAEDRHVEGRPRRRGR